ncbi:MAG: hypothetical protein ABSG62_21450 [Terracidiphilus sp.]|jgi:hypothetical protein
MKSRTPGLAVKESRKKQDFAPALRDGVDARWNANPGLSAAADSTLGYFRILPAGKIDAEAASFILRGSATPVGD